MAKDCQHHHHRLRLAGVRQSVAKPKILSSSLTPHSPPNLTTFPGRPQCPASPSRALRLWPGCRGAGFSLAKAPTCWGPADESFLLQGSEGFHGQPRPAASSLRPQADGNQKAAYPWAQLLQAQKSPCPHPAAAAPALARLLPPLWASRAARDGNGWTLWESHVCQPGACQLSGGSHKGPFHQGEELALEPTGWCPRAQGQRARGQKLRKGLLRLRESEVLRNPSPRPCHHLMPR